MMGILKNLTVPDEWFYSETFQYWQKTQGRGVCYISPLLYGFSVQFYTRGDINFCKLEARTPEMTQEGVNILIELAQKWLNEYESGDMELIMEDPYSISNPEGVWGKRTGEKLYWINP